jgi:hypothetical protein
MMTARKNGEVVLPDPAPTVASGAASGHGPDTLARSPERSEGSRL